MGLKQVHLNRKSTHHIWPRMVLLAAGLLAILGLGIAVGPSIWFRLRNPIDHFHFAPGKTTWNALPDKPAGAIRWAVVGDFGIGNTNEKYVADMVHSWNPDFIITTGDDNYPDGQMKTIDAHVGKYYHDYIYPYQGTYGPGATRNRFFPILGNHDWHLPSVQSYLDYFTLPGNERYYDFVWGPVHFFALDSSSHEPDGWSSDSVQAQWLKEKLAASDSAWNVVYMHEPPFSSSLHGSTTILQWPFQEWGATAVLSGHDHVYERVMRDGFAYFVDGLGGGKIYDFYTPVQGSEARYNKMHGAMLIEATPDSITFRFYSIDQGGTLIDSYTIKKDTGAGPT